MNTYDPWGVGRILDIGGAQFPVQYCRIRQTFEGQLGKGFTNSCTLLVELLGDLPTWLEGHRHAVVKVIDLNFCTNIKEAYKMSDTFFDNTMVRTASEKESEQRFRAWLKDPIPEMKIQSSSLPTLVNGGQLSAQPTYGEVLLRGLQLTGFQAMMIRQGITRSLSKRECQIVIEEFSEMCFSHEVSILSFFTANDPSHILPVFLGSTRISSSSATTCTKESAIMTDCPAIIMEYIEGMTLAEWAAHYTKETEPRAQGANDSLQQGTQEANDSLEQDVIDICDGCVIANGIPLIFGFQHCDIREDNYQVYRDPASNRFKVRLVDADGLHRVLDWYPYDREAEESHNTSVQRLFGKGRWQASLFDLPSFSSAVDHLTTAMLKDVFQRSPYISSQVEPKLRHLDLFKVLDEPLDTLFWQIIQQGLWHFRDTSSAVREIRRTIEALHHSSIIMNYTMTETRSESEIYWGWIAFQRVSAAFCEDGSLESLEKFIRALQASVRSLKDQNDLESYFTSHPKLIASIVKNVAIFQHQSWREHREPLSDFKTWLQQCVERVCYQDPDVKGIEHTLNKTGMLSTKLFFYDDTRLDSTNSSHSG